MTTTPLVLSMSRARTSGFDDQMSLGAYKAHVITTLEDLPLEISRETIEAALSKGQLTQVIEKAQDKTELRSVLGEVLLNSLEQLDAVQEYNLGRLLKYDSPTKGSPVDISRFKPELRKQWTSDPGDSGNRFIPDQKHLDLVIADIPKLVAKFHKLAVKLKIAES